MSKVFLIVTVFFCAVCLSAQPAANLSGGNTNSTASAPNRKVTVPPEKAKPMSLPRFETPPVIDGKMDEPVWQQAAVFKDFYQINPGDNTEPSKPTIAYMGYDARMLYFAFHCFDEPDKIRATVAKRDQVFGEDNVRVYLDTFNDQRRAYLIGFNPLGIQADGLFSVGNGGNNNGIDFSVDIVMESKGQIVSDGWIVEVAIPFKSLRYEAGGDKRWGIHIWRNIDRFNDELDSWMPISRDITGTLNQAGHITGLDGIATERTLEIIPSVTVSKSGQRTFDGFTNRGFQGDYGVNVKLGINPNTTLDVAINPDFADVEADSIVLQANQRFPIFFPERRPFFLEGKDIFQTQIQVLDTRRIADPDLAVKLSGKQGRTVYGLMLASDSVLSIQNDKFLQRNSQAAVLRLRRDIGKENFLGLVATSSDFTKRHNQLAGIDGRFRFGDLKTLNFQVVGSSSRRNFYDPDTNASRYRKGYGTSYLVSFNQSGRYFSWNYNAQGRNQDYRADLGFVRRLNTNYQGVFLNYNSEPQPKAKLINFRVGGGGGVNFDWQGRMQNNEANVETNFRLKGNYFFGGGGGANYERIFEEEFGPRRNARQAGQFSGPDNGRSTRNYNTFAYFGGNPNQRYGFFALAVSSWNEFDLDFGAGPRFPRVSPAYLEFRRNPNLPEPAQDPGPGRSWHLEANASYQPVSKISLSLEWSYDQLRRNDTGELAFKSHIFSLRTRYQFTNFIFFRSILDYNTLNGSVRGQQLFGWAPRPGTAFYVGYNNAANYRAFHPDINGIDRFETGLRQINQTFFIKFSYLFRKSFGG
jgi:hypothetical protein